MRPGTPVYTVKGYDQAFRLAAHGYGRLYMYQVVENTKARTGADLLDISGKVREIRIGGYDPEPKLEPRSTIIREPRQIRRLTDLILRAPAMPRHEYAGSWTGVGRFYRLQLILEDGTVVKATYTVSRGFSASQQWLGTVIQLPKQFVALLEAALR